MLLAPNNSESRSDFILRCMSNNTMNDEYPDNRQRLTECASQWINRNKEKQMDHNDMLFKTAYIEKGSLSIEERTVIGYASTSIVDRHNQVILNDAWQLDNYRKHAIIFLNHNHQDLWIGSALWIKTDNKGLLFKMKFANTEKAEEVFQLIKDTGIAAFSIGARASAKKEMTFNELPKRIQNASGEMDAGLIVTVITKAELLEISVVGLPANAGSVVSNEMVMYNSLIKDIGDIEVDTLELTADPDPTDVEKFEARMKELIDERIAEALKKEEPEQVVIEPDPEIEIEDSYIDIENIDKPEITEQDVMDAVSKAMSKYTSMSIDVDKLITKSRNRLLGKID